MLQAHITNSLSMGGGGGGGSLMFDLFFISYPIKELELFCLFVLFNVSVNCGC